MGVLKIILGMDVWLEISTTTRYQNHRQTNLQPILKAMFINKGKGLVFFICLNEPLHCNLIFFAVFVTRDISTHWVLKAPLCDSRSAHIGNQTSGRQAGFIHTTRDQKLLTRNMKGF